MRAKRALAVDTIEVNQISLDIPQGSETAAVGFMTGLIATLAANTPSSVTEQARLDKRRRAGVEQGQTVL